MVSNKISEKRGDAIYPDADPDVGRKKQNCPYR
jgi:hypothetical protein